MRESTGADFMSIRKAVGRRGLLLSASETIMTTLHPVDSCPRCGWPTLARKGRTLCCDARTSEIREGIRIKERRCQQRKEKTELSGAETEGGGNLSLAPSAGQLVLFAKEE